MTTFLIVAAVSGLAFGVMAIIQAVALQKQVEELDATCRGLAKRLRESGEFSNAMFKRHIALAERLVESEKRRDAALPTPKWPGDAA